VSATGHLLAEERQRIHAAIEAVERRTSADLDILVVTASDRYSLYPLVWALVGAVLTVGAIALVWPRLGLRYAFVIQLAVLTTLTVLFDWFPIRIALVPQAVKYAHARLLARREFAAQAAVAAERRHILLFVSLAERYVEIIADRDTHALAGPVWDKIVADFVGTTRTNGVAEGLLRAIQACGELLESHHPAPW
jgi:putative membrane protein